MRIFMTGATGYIGRAVAEALFRRGYDLLALAHSERAARDLAARGYDVLRGDLTQAAVLAEGARQADGVVHLGLVREGDVAGVDTAAVQVLLDALAGTDKPFLYTSGVWVLGATGPKAADEATPPAPVELVAWRSRVERMVQEAPVRGVVIRPALVYGHGGGIPAMFVEAAREGKPVRLPGDGRQRWPFVHVADLAELYVRALDAPAGTILHGVGEPAVAAWEVAAEAARAAGSTAGVAAWPLSEARAELGAFADALALDQHIVSTAAQRLFGWAPTHSGVLDDLRHGSYTWQEAQAFICTTCGTQFAPSDGPPPRCPICEDARQYVGKGGQAWTTMPALRRTHRNVVRAVEPGLTEIFTEPSFGIGQRALLVETPEGNVLWDAITLLDEETVRAVEARGGLAAIAVSHPHYYSAVAAWSHAFGDVPVYLHTADRSWVMHPDPVLRFWEGDTLDLPGGLRLVRVGGHFPGSAVLYWPRGAAGRGALLTGDSIKVAADRRYVSFMYSFPNHVPLGPAEVRAIVEAVAPLRFDRIYGAWTGDDVRTGATAAVRRSAERYLEAGRGRYPAAEAAPRP
ncbi:NAD-dependent epimerase/dehydratase family protein [Rhodocaloribacter litoris]|uniref:NAD-dependent epimerase/dehydratase family protein n=1 Tax=Rhodocaloribacter litoris TaxID=2558931 RepID=UPI001E282F48|nr:NAD-dependent epimerase/dehydratase family protein [Rhodocaloribacter litoris]QXD17009.1 NAD-dependent epimerase/dehydratase family protein [Rhodocaloribacter litoris]